MGIPGFGDEHTRMPIHVVSGHVVSGHRGNRPVLSATKGDMTR
jgi:hypothetical protein